MKDKRQRINFILFSLGKFVSIFGASIYSFATGLHVLKITGSGMTFALSIIVSIIPIVIINPFAGVIADKFDKKKIVVAMDIVNGIFLVLLYIVSGIYGLRVQMIYISTLITSIFTTIFGISMEAAIPNIVSENMLMNINSASKIIDSMSSVLGPMVGGIIFAFIDIRYFILFNGISYIFSGISEIFIDFKYNDYNVGDGYSAIKNIGFDSNFLEFFKLPVDEGRFLNKEDFDRTDVVPIVLGSNYREIYKLGDEFKAKDNIHNKIYKYKVIGFLKEDSYCLESTQQVETINLNNYMLLPYMDSFIDTEETFFRLDFYDSQGAIFSRNPEKNAEYFNEIRSKSEEMDLYKYKYYSSEEQFKEFEGFVKSDLEQSTMIFSIVLLFCSIGIITSILSSIDTRTTEFGIHLLCGAKISDIILRIVLETSMIIGCSFLFITSINIFKFKDMKSTPYLLIFSLGTIMFLTIIPVIKLMRFHVNDIIRGKE